MTEKEIFDKFESMDPNPGKKDRIRKEGKYFILPGWIISSKESEIKYTTSEMKKLYAETGITKQILYDILILGITSIDDRPKCPVCGNPIKFRDNLLGKFSGYNKTCCAKCRYELNKPILISEEVMKRSVATRKKTGAYDHMIGNTFRKDNPPTEESKAKQSAKMKGRKRSQSSREKQSKTNFEKFKNNPETLKNFINSSNGRSKKGTIKINKSINKEFHYLSSWEEKLVLFLDTEVDDVIQIESPKGILYIYNNSQHNYYADIDITLSNNKKLLIEIKPTVHLYHKKNKAKFSAGKEFVTNNNIYSDYLILTEKELFENPRKQDIIFKKNILNIINKYVTN